LTHIFILQPHRKCGIGSSLVNLCIGKARNAGLPLSLQSEPAAHDFFLKRGFKDTKHVDFNLAKWAPPCTGFGLFRLSGMVLRM
jgi:N-acetylglutamate synthase-like GNAT family acetyltransferase